MNSITNKKNIKYPLYTSNTPAPLSQSPPPFNKLIHNSSLAMRLETDLQHIVPENKKKILDYVIARIAILEYFFSTYKNVRL